MLYTEDVNPDVMKAVSCNLYGMKRKIQKSQLPAPEPIIFKIDPTQCSNGIILPKVKYQLVASIEEEQAFHGMVLPLPKVLVYFLTHTELMIVATIIEDTNNTGTCSLTVREFAKRIMVSIPTLSNALYSLRRRGLLLEVPNGKRGAGKLRIINYDTVQYLNDLVKDEDTGVFIRIRRATRRKIDINHLTKADIKKAYDNIVLEPGHDPAEEEEYD